MYRIRLSMQLVKKFWNTTQFTISNSYYLLSPRSVSNSADVPLF